MIYLLIVDCEIVGTFATLKKAREELKKHSWGKLYEAKFICSGGNGE